MHPYPHQYQVTAAGSPAGVVTVTAAALPAIETAPPPQFDGPDGMWSPETLLCASVADCFILTFRAVARAARMEWLALECNVDGTLERLEGKAQFTRYVVHATLTVPFNADVKRAHSLLEQAEHGCLVSNSLRGQRELDAHVVVAAQP